jgi:hypothetical protein
VRTLLGLDYVPWRPEPPRCGSRAQARQSFHLKGDFVLRSGKRSNRYFDRFLFETELAGCASLASTWLAHTEETQRLAAPELGAVLPGGAVSMETAFRRSSSVRAEGIRDAEADEGRFERDRVTVIEDVVTTGGDSLRSAQVLGTPAWKSSTWSWPRPRRGRRTSAAQAWRTAPVSCIGDLELD